MLFSLPQGARLSRRASHREHRQPAGRRLRLESLETRALLAAFIVNTTADTIDVSPGDSLAADARGLTSLRAAVMESNALGGANTIQLDAQSYSLLRGITGAPGTLAITSDITLIGAGAAATTIHTTDAFRLFDVQSGASLTIAGVTLTGGRAPVGGSGGAYGGAIATQGQLTVRDSVIRDNFAEYGGGGIWVSGVSGSAVIEGTTFEHNRAQWGGALATRSGTIAVVDGSFRENSATDRGGAIQNEFGTVVVTGGTLTGNYVGNSPTSPAGTGGAVHNNGDMTLVGVTVSNNSAWFGGGIRNDREMTIDSSTVSSNVSADTGGGLSNWGGNLSVTGSTLAGNRGTYGGALWSNSAVVVADSILRDNHASANGGAISNAGTGTLEVLGSTLASNTAVWGGAVLNGGNASMQMVNSTVSGNTSRYGGGGIQNWGPLTVSHSTFVGNLAGLNANGQGGGGGIRGNQAVIQLQNTLLAGNLLLVESQYQADDITGDIASTSSFNLIGDALTSGGLIDGVNGNIVGDGGVGTLPIASILDTRLLSNGGPTPTHALLRGSLAIDAAASPAEVPRDQRGLSRPVGGASDIGAYEVQSSDPGFNSSPQAVDDFYALLAGGSLTVAAPDGVLANETDPEGDVLTALLVDAPQFGTVQLAPDGSFLYTPNEGFVGTDRFSYRASDGLLESNLATVTLEVEIDRDLSDNIRIGDGSGTIDLAAPWIRVVIFGSDQLDVSLIDVGSLRFGVTGAEDSIERSGRGAKARLVYEWADLDGNGHLDLVVRFETKRTGLSVGASELTLAGYFHGEPFSVTQPVTVVSTGGGGKGGGGKPPKAR